MNTHQAAANGHDVHDDADTSGFTLRTYLIGFVLAAILTAIPFWIVMTGAIPAAGTARAVIIVFAIAQIIVQTVTFLHVNARAQGGWTLMAYVFTTVLLVITIAGSIWIMYHLNVNMMPGMMGDPAVSQPP
jgi:cytochrome o ubiquinol oxidase operon protein cyoD